MKCVQTIRLNSYKRNKKPKICITKIPNKKLEKKIFVALVTQL